MDTPPFLLTIGTPSSTSGPGNTMPYMIRAAGLREVPEPLDLPMLRKQAKPLDPEVLVGRIRLDAAGALRRALALPVFSSRTRLLASRCPRACGRPRVGEGAALGESAPRGEKERPEELTRGGEVAGSAGEGIPSQVCAPLGRSGVLRIEAGCEGSRGARWRSPCAGDQRSP